MNVTGAPQVQGRWSRLAWIPIPLLAAVIAGLWVANLRTAYESQWLMVVLNLLFSWLTALCMVVLTARGFLGSAQPGLLMFGCGSLLWGSTSLAAAAMVDSGVNQTITVHNLGVFGSALCHLIGVVWCGRLPRPERWLVAGFTAALLVAAGIVLAAMAGVTPEFFVQGRGGTPIRQVVLLLAVAQFAWVAWQMLSRFRRQTGAFYYWYGLGLALVATGLSGVMPLSVQAGILGWTNRFTQYLGSAYLLIAAFVAAREVGSWTFSLTAVDEAMQKLWRTAGMRRSAGLRGLLRYGMALAAVAAAAGLHLLLESWVGPGLPADITFYPAVMVVALMAGFGPGVVATALAGYFVACWMAPPMQESYLAAAADRMALVIFASNGLFMSAMAQLYRRTRQVAAAYDREAALRETQQRLATFAEATFEGIIQSQDGQIIDCNEQFADMLGYAVSELQGMQIAALIDPEDRERITANILQQRTSMVEHTLLRKDGSRLIVEARGRPVSPGSALRHTAMRDVSAHKQGAQLLRTARSAALNLMQDSVSARHQAEVAEAAMRVSELAERARREELETLMDALPVAVFVAQDAACQQMTGNRAAMELLRLAGDRSPSLGAPADQRPDYEVWSAGRRLEVHELLMQRAAATGQAVSGEEGEIVFPDGERRQLLGSALPIFDAAGTVRGCVGTFVDITARKHAEVELSRANRTLLALTESNRMLLLTTTEAQLLQEVCRIISEVCGHARVWIGFAEDDAAKTVRPVASAGFEDACLHTLRISWAADNPRGRGPTGTAIRDSRPCHCTSVLTDPRLAPWRDEALLGGYVSSLALPLLEDGKAFGAVTIDSREAAGFSADEVKLLADLAGDLARGIATLRLREAHQQAEAALRESEARFRSIFHHSATPMAVKLPDGRFLEVNQAYCKMLGCAEAEVLCAAAEDFTYPGDGNAAAAVGQLVAGEVTAIRTEKRYLHKRGHLVWCDTSVSVVSDADGAVAYVIVQAHDITARKEAEENIIRLNHQLESRVLERTAELHEIVQALEAEMAQRQRLEREILEISEREQCRLGQDLHDGLGQELAGIAMLGDVHARQLLAEAHASAPAAAKIAAYIRTTIDSARRLAKGLYPIELSRYGLLLALKDLAAQTCHRSGICCDLRQSDDAPRLEPSAEIHIYRIVQECIGNAVKHGKPQHISIDSEARGDMHIFAVTDDGVGFDHAAEHAGMGLHLMHYRARVIGAQILVETPAQGGCRITCQLPIGQPPRRKLRKAPI